MISDALPIVSRWLHLGAVIVAVGGAVFIRFVLTTAVDEALEVPARARLGDAVRRRWRRVVHTCIAIILASGLFNLHHAAQSGKPTAYYLLFVGKLLAALAVFFLASALVGRTPVFAVLRQRPRPWLGLVVALAGAILLLSGIMHAMPSGP